MCVLVDQSCLTLCNPMDCSPPLSSLHGILQARILEGLPYSPPRDLPEPGIKPTSLMSPALAVVPLPLELPGKPISGFGVDKGRDMAMKSSNT